jgi:hypothetical protein
MSSALWPDVPVRSRTATSSASDSAEAPSASKRSRWPLDSIIFDDVHGICSPCLHDALGPDGARASESGAV